MHTRFKPGQSGNPKGRPRKKRHSDDLLLQVVNRKVPYRRQGRSVEDTLLRITYEQLANMAAGGDLAAIRELLNRLEKFLPAQPTLTDEQQLAIFEYNLTTLSDDECETFRRIMEKLKQPIPNAVTSTPDV